LIGISLIVVVVETWIGGVTFIESRGSWCWFGILVVGGSFRFIIEISIVVLGRFTDLLVGSSLLIVGVEIIVWLRLVRFVRLSIEIISVVLGNVRGRLSIVVIVGVLIISVEIWISELRNGCEVVIGVWIWVGKESERFSGVVVVVEVLI
jgi:hypothetical protein